MLQKETNINTYQPSAKPVLKRSLPPLQSQTPVISSQAYYPNLDHNHRLRNSIAPAVEPYGLEKRFPIPRSDMYSYDHYPNHIRPAYDPYPYYHPVTISNSPAPIMEVEEKKTQERVVKSSVRSVDEESDDERKKRFLERNRVAASKCRQKRKALTQELELRSSELFQKNRELKIEVNMLQAENEKLRERLLKYEESDTRV